MKFNRTVVISALLITLMITLTGCIEIPQYKYYNISPDEVASVQIYDLRASDTYYDSFFENNNPVYSLPEDSTFDFLKDLAEIRFKDSIIITIAAIDPSFSFGEWVVRINHTDGSYDLISCGGYGQSCNENNELTDINHYSCDDEIWNKFVISYLPADFIIKQVV